MKVKKRSCLSDCPNKQPFFFFFKQAKCHNYTLSIITDTYTQYLETVYCIHGTLVNNISVHSFKHSCFSLYFYIQCIIYFSVFLISLLSCIYCVILCMFALCVYFCTGSSCRQVKFLVFVNIFGNKSPPVSDSDSILAETDSWKNVGP